MQTVRLLTTVSLPAPPAAPTSLYAELTGASTLALRWLDNSTDETGFILQRRISGGTFATFATLAAGTISTTDTTLAPLATYDYRVLATGAAGNSAPTNTITVTTPAAAADVTYRFDEPDLDTRGELINGVRSGIDFGTGKWFWYDTWQGLAKVGYFAEGILSQTISLPPGTVLRSLRAGSNATTTYTLSAPGLPTRSGLLPGPNEPTTLTTNWTSPSPTVTIGFGNGWDTDIDDIVYGPATPALTAAQLWRQTFFGATAATGTAAPAADPDADGMTNLLEYALGTDPTSATANANPTPLLSTTASTLSLSYLRARAELTYTVETTTDLATVPWTSTGVTQATTPAGQMATASVPYTPAASAKRFLRLRVTQP
jgi:hypothetical protein